MVYIFCRSFTFCFWPDSEPTKLLHHPKQMTSKDVIKGLVSLSSFVHALGAFTALLPRASIVADEEVFVQFKGESKKQYTRKTLD